MKKIFTIAALSALSLGASAQSNTSSYHTMRVVKTDGTEIFYKTTEVDHVDFIMVEEEEPDNSIKVFLAGNSENENGPCKVNRMEKTGPDGGCILAYPDPSTDPNTKHPVVIWGPGGGTEPGAYGGMINRLASQGFVVLALSSSPGNGNSASKAIDWLENISEQEGKPLYHKLILDRIGCAGHSMGGLESEQALLKDKRVYTACLNNSGDLGHSAMSQIKTGKPIAIVYGEKGMERPNAEADYNNSGVTTPACLIMMTGGDPNSGEGGYGHGSAAWDGIGATVAWMRWHLGGETFRKDDFTTPNGTYISGQIVNGFSWNSKWSGKYKNWENWKE